MKRLINKMLLLIAVIISVGSLSCTTTRVAAVNTPQRADVNFQVFYDALSPYGQWVSYPDYGYVWAPNAGAGFSPYATNGHWVYSTYGWTWVSDYNWGWAPFHYGRWMYDNMYGWLWVPGNEWAPAWVAWRHANDYYGWAPLGPGLNINVSFGYRIPAARWVFLPARYMCNPYMNRYYAPRERNVTIINNSTIINNVYENNHTHVRYFSGPRTTNVQHYTRQNVRTVNLQESHEPGQTVVTNDNAVRIFRPAVTQSNNHTAPSRVYALHDIKPVDERSANTGVVNNDAKPQRIFHSNNANNNSSENVNPATRNDNNNVHFNSEFDNAQHNNQPVNNNADNNNSQADKPVKPVRSFDHGNNHLTIPHANNNQQENINHQPVNTNQQENVNRNTAPVNNNVNQPDEKSRRHFSPDKPVMRQQQRTAPQPKQKIQSHTVQAEQHHQRQFKPVEKSNDDHDNNTHARRRF